jgi:hypothetical protein
MEVEELKKEYFVLAKKHSLPDFKKLNEDFEIDKIERKSDCMLRAIRKAMMDKIINSVGFFDMLLNPGNAPRMYLNFIKNMNSDDKEIIGIIYAKLAELSLISLELEVEYNENGEAGLINKTFQEWVKIKPEFSKILAKIRKPSESDSIRKEKSYFG